MIFGVKLKNDYLLFFVFIFLFSFLSFIVSFLNDKSSDKGFLYTNHTNIDHDHDGDRGDDDWVSFLKVFYALLFDCICLVDFLIWYSIILCVNSFIHSFICTFNQTNDDNVDHNDVVLMTDKICKPNQTSQTNQPATHWVIRPLRSSVRDIVIVIVNVIIVNIMCGLVFYFQSFDLVLWLVTLYVFLITLHLRLLLLVLLLLPSTTATKYTIGSGLGVSLSACLILNGWSVVFADAVSIEDSSSLSHY